MVFVYKARPVASVDKALRAIKEACPKATAIIVRGELGSERLLYFSLFLSFKALQSGENRARTPELEWLSRLSCTGNISSALLATAPRKGRDAAIASTVAFPLKLKRTLGITGEAGGGCDEKFIKEFYGLTEAALSNYSATDLAMEKMAVEAAR